MLEIYSKAWLQQEESTDEDYLKKCSDIEKIAIEMMEQLEESIEYTMDAENACIEAKEMAGERNEKKSKECLKAGR
jgi:hypothetical protein